MRSSSSTSSDNNENTARSSPTLSDSEVNKRIQLKFCKVISDYGEGTGYIIDDEKGRVLSSFHLVGAIKPLKFTGSQIRDNNYVKTALCTVGYLDSEMRLTKNALKVNSEEEITKKILENKFDKFSMTVEIDPNAIKEILVEDINKKWMVQQLKNALEDEKNRFLFNAYEPTEVKIAYALLIAGHLNDSFCLKDKSQLSKIDFNTINITPITREYKCISSSSPLPAKTIQAIKEIFSRKETVDEILDFFKKGREEKDVVLLSDCVQIQCGSEIMTGKVNFPADIKDEDKKKVLRNFAFFDTVPIQITQFASNIPFNAGIKIIRTGKKIEPLPDDQLPIIGDKVYFGGYPLTQQEYTFSIGMISSITFTEDRKCFVIEAPVAPGNSGSPVFIQRNGKIYWIGIINSEVAHVSEEILETREKLTAIEKGGITMAGLDILISLKEIISTLLNNLSTGKGKAFEILSEERLYDKKNELNVDPFLDFLVPRKGKNDIREKIRKELEENATTSVQETFIWNEKTYYLNPDNHGNKHTRNSKRIEESWKKDKRNTAKNWNSNDATFNVQSANNYKDILKKAIMAVAREEGRSDFVRFPYSVGWDKGSNKQGEETCIVELYYEDTGSHIRPKAASMVSSTQIIDVEPTSLTIAASMETDSKENSSNSTPSNSFAHTKMDIENDGDFPDASPITLLQQSTPSSLNTSSTASFLEHFMSSQINQTLMAAVSLDTSNAPVTTTTVSASSQQSSSSFQPSTAAITSTALRSHSAQPTDQKNEQHKNNKRSHRTDGTEEDATRNASVPKRQRSP